MYTSSRFSLNQIGNDEDTYFHLRIGTILIGFFSILSLVTTIFYIDCNEFLGGKYSSTNDDSSADAASPRLMILYFYTIVSTALMIGAICEKVTFIVPWLCFAFSWLVLNFLATSITMARSVFDFKKFSYMADFIALSTIAFGIQLCIFLVVFKFYKRVIEILPKEAKFEKREGNQVTTVTFC